MIPRIVFRIASLTILAVSAQRRRATEECVPASVDAPYGLDVPQYRWIYTNVRIAHDELTAAGCEYSLLTNLASCAPLSEKEIDQALMTADAQCEKKINHLVRDTLHFLEGFGCIEEAGQLSKTSAGMIHTLLETSRLTSSRTTCSALMRGARRAFQDSLIELDISEALSDLHANAPLQAGSVTTRPPSESLPQDEEPGQKPRHGNEHSLWAALFAGALAGLAVDLSLFPLDTVKTRLQSAGGFLASGGFKGLYQGIGSIALGSAPSSALFFLAYVFVGQKLTKHIGETFMSHLVATTIGELASSLVRVPADVVKSRQQVQTFDGLTEATSLWVAIQRVYQEGSRPNSRWRYGAFYTGWLSSIVREIPFGCIQFPLFEYLKGMANAGNTDPLSMPLTALCGMIAGSFAGSLTTPLDVVKTRIMLAERSESGILNVLFSILRKEGIQGLFRGVIPRTLWISLGGAIFLGGYDGFARLIDSFLQPAN